MSVLIERNSLSVRVAKRNENPKKSNKVRNITIKKIMMKSRIIKATLSIILLFFTISVAVAQQTITKEIKVCDTDVRPINLGEDVIGISLTPRGGTWAEVKPESPYTTVIKNNVSNIFVAIDRQPGKYAFVYTAKNNVCMTNGDKAIAIIEILETPKPIHINVALCEGETKDLNLNNYVSNTLKTKYPTGITFKNSNGNTLVGGILPISATFQGTDTATYTIAALTANACNTKATITLDVTRTKETINTKDLTGEKTFCISALPPNLNLNNELGIAGNGTWSATSTTIPINNGIIDFTGATIGTHNYIFTFDGTSPCIPAGTEANFVVNIMEDMTTLIATEGSLNICKTRNPQRKIELQSILNISIPINAGEWTPDAGNPSNSVDVTNGYFEIEDAPIGTYIYKFRISNAIDLCGLENREGTVKIILEDGGNFFDGEVQICSANVPTELDLSTYVSGLSGYTVEWYQFDGTTVIPTGKINPSQLAVGTHKYVYKTGAADCKSEGVLYVTIEDVITNFTNKEVSYCLTDDGADAINLKEVLGVAGVPGNWTTTVTGPNYNATTQVFNGKTQGKGTYTFTFTADTTAGCGLAGRTATVTVKITDTLIP